MNGLSAFLTQLLGQSGLSALSDDVFRKQYDDYLRQLNAGQADYASGNDMRAEQKRRFGLMQNKPEPQVVIPGSGAKPVPRPPQAVKPLDAFGVLADAMKTRE